MILHACTFVYTLKFVHNYNKLCIYFYFENFIYLLFLFRKRDLERMYRIMFLSFRLLHQRNLRISERPHLNLKGSSSWLLPKRGSRIRRKIQSWPNLRELKTPGLKWIQFLALKTSHIKLTSSLLGFFPPNVEYVIQQMI